MKARIEIPKAELKKFERKLDNMSKEQQKEMQNHVNMTALLIETDAKKIVPVKTGRLKSSIHMESRNSSTGSGLGGVNRKLTAKVGTNVRYAEDVHNGTRPHIITPKKKPLLKFKIGNQWVSSKRVNHPGTKGNPFLRKAFNMNKRYFLNGIKRILK